MSFEKMRRKRRAKSSDLLPQRRRQSGSCWADFLIHAIRTSAQRSGSFHIVAPSRSSLRACAAPCHREKSARTTCTSRKVMRWPQTITEMTKATCKACNKSASFLMLPGLPGASDRKLAAKFTYRVSICFILRPQLKLASSAPQQLIQTRLNLLPTKIRRYGKYWKERVSFSSYRQLLYL
jgi:hypothetical protein